MPQTPQNMMRAQVDFCFPVAMRDEGGLRDWGIMRVGCRAADSAE